MALRPRHTRSSDFFRITGTILIAVHLFLSAWLVIQFEGQYTEGQPSPTKVKALVAIDKDQTLIDVEMENSTSFLFYMLFRDYEEPVSNESQQNSNQPNSAIEDKESSSDSVEWLDIGRKLTLGSLIFLVLCELLVVAGIPFRATLRCVLWTGVVACFLIVMPATYVLDLGGDGGGDSNDDSAIADETFVAQTEEGAMAHEKTNLDTNILLRGIRLEMMFSGYDLGLVEPENYSAVRENPPTENDTDSSAYVEFHSQLDLVYGKNIPSVFLIPFLWFLFPAKTKIVKNYDLAFSDEQE